MLDSGGISGGTNWQSLRVPDMWSMLENHDGAAHDHMIGGWRQSYELVLEHLSGVQRYRESLAEAWPPERSRASQAYMERLDALIASLKDTYEAAVENHRALAGATGSLNSARKTMEGIQREHAANEVLLAGFEEEKRAYQLTPSKGKGVPPQSPIAEGRQAQLDEEARRVMRSLSAELALAQVSIIQPKPYTPPRTRGEDDKPFFIESDANYPPPGAAAPFSPGGGGRRAAPTTSSAGAPNQPTRPGGGLPPESIRPGPVLGEVGRPATNPPLGGRTQAPLPPATNNGRLTPVPPRIPSPLGLVPSVGGRNTAVPPSAPPSSNVGASRTSDAFTKAPAPPTSIIGGIPGSHATPSTTPSRPPQRVNPIGGLIGQPNPAPSTPRRSEAKSAERIRDYTWEVSDGVAPVLLPHTEKRIDTGPVIGRN